MDNGWLRVSIQDAYKISIKRSEWSALWGKSPVLPGDRQGLARKIQGDELI